MPSKRTRTRKALPSSYTPAPGHRFNVGDRVVIKRAFPPGHRRTPCYIRGKEGVIERICGAFPNPEELAYGFDGRPEKVLYRVRFKQNHVWPDYKGPARDIIEMEIFEHWLLPASGRVKQASLVQRDD
ncbi:MAG TPA: SH3-like domain-containing protein [Burkholderiales bacterium]|nr:SH3-like domain-containing protein [Burkholderiales bacterium]